MKARVVAHPFEADPDLPPDHLGRHVCKRCHLLGRPGDPHHDTAELDAEQAEARRWAGEREDA
jgi:hypothetical protein